MDDKRHLLINGRRWRRSDPTIPHALRAEMVAELMSARRAVGEAIRAGDVAAQRFARVRVHDAKTALGERGRSWWEASPDFDRSRAAATIRTLLRHRTGTICPSDVARAVGGDEWRSVMPSVIALAKELTRQGQLRILQRADDVRNLDTVTGPIRLALSKSSPDSRPSR